MYAIIATGGKQYRVSQGDVIFVEKIEQDVDSTIDFDVLMLAGDDGCRQAAQRYYQCICAYFGLEPVP